MYIPFRSSLHTFQISGRFCESPHTFAKHPTLLLLCCASKNKNKSKSTRSADNQTTVIWLPSVRPKRGRSVYLYLTQGSQFRARVVLIYVSSTGARKSLSLKNGSLTRGTPHKISYKGGKCPSFFLHNFYLDKTVIQY